MFAERVHFNSAYRSSIVETALANAKMKKTGSRNFGKENGGCFSCSYHRVGRAGKLLVFFYFVKRIWLII